MRRLVPGDSFALEREVPHAKRYGERGGDVLGGEEGGMSGVRPGINH